MSEDGVPDISEFTTPAASAQEKPDLKDIPDVAEPTNEKPTPDLKEVTRDVENSDSQDRDKEGYVLFSGIRDSFIDAASGKADQSDIGNVLYIYKAAENASREIGKTGPENDVSDGAGLVKAVVALKDFHKQLGMDEYAVDIRDMVDSDEYKEKEAALKAKLESDYKGTGDPDAVEAKIKEDLKDFRRDENRRLIQRKVREDVSRMPELYAHVKMQPYYETKAARAELQDDFKDKLPSPDAVDGGVYAKGLELADLPPRDMTRMEAYELQRNERTLRKIEDDLVKSLNNKADVRNVKRLRNERTSAQYGIQDAAEGNEGEDVSFKDKPEDEKDKIIAERQVRLQTQIEESMGQEGLKAFEGLPDSEKRAILDKLIGQEEGFRNALENVGLSLETGNSGEICDRYGELKSTRSEIKTTLAELKVKLAAQKAENARIALQDAARDYAKGTPGGASRVVSLMTERVVKLVGAKIEPYKQSILKAADNVAGAYGGASDKVAESVTKAAAEIHDKIGSHLESTSPAMRRVNTELVNEVSSVKPLVEMKRIDITKKFYEKKHALKREADRAVGILAADIKTEKSKLGLKVRREFIPSLVEVATGKGTLKDTENKTAYETELQGIRDAYRKMVDQVDLGVEHKFRKNPDFEYFWKEAEKNVKGLPDIGQEEIDAKAENASPSLETPDEVPPADIPASVEKPLEEPAEDPAEVADHKSAAEKETPKVNKADWEPELEEHKKLWEELKDQEEEARRDPGSTRKLIDALIETSNRINKDLRTNAEEDKFNGNELGQQYLELSRQLEELEEQAKGIGSGKDTTSELSRRTQRERELANNYRKLLVDKWKLYGQMRKNGLIK